MKREDVRRAMDKAESFFEMLLLDIISLPKPFTAIVVAVVLILSGVGAVTVWNAL